MRQQQRSLSGNEVGLTKKQQKAKVTGGEQVRAVVGGEGREVKAREVNGGSWMEELTVVRT